MSERASEVLRSAIRLKGCQGYLFPGKRSDHCRKPTLALLFKRHGNGQTAHGCRSCFRDWAAECSDLPKEVAEKALGHVVGSVAERAYFRSDLLEKRRELMEAWAAYLERTGPQE